jgi:hypothetical protein
LMRGSERSESSLFDGSGRGGARSKYLDRQIARMRAYRNQRSGRPRRR